MLRWPPCSLGTACEGPVHLQGARAAGRNLLYIEARNRTAARRVKARIKRATGRLARHPYSCRTTEHPGIRVLAVVRYPYLVFYSVDDVAKEVRILRIRHYAQDPSRHLD